MIKNEKVGQITTAVWSPKFQKNIALGMVMRGAWHTGQQLTIHAQGSEPYMGTVYSELFQKNKYESAASNN